ncbi:PAS domain-containing protein [Muricauda sp. JGD-17]|uniref:PAS domain-containing protein n=1 Tax=Flagellimonas ochracea TaxID=2696472 RepID=A0A964WXH2_9FLAO|nr:PAS domain-containing protein [Allomuricauda ochracea]NAY91808.1 PAS domain-containing protein [Allomuricauda ochracea]
MEKIRFYEEAVNHFHGKRSFSALPICSVEFYAQRFNRVCENLHDTKNLNHLANSGNWQGDIPFQEEILDKEHVVVVTDENLNIVYATQNMRLMNGYRPQEVIGKTPKLFQGKDTCKETSKKVSKAVKSLSPFEVVLTNYSKDGAPYKCWIKGAPVYNKSGKVVNFIAFEKKVA